VDFAGVSRNLNATLATANQKLQGLDTARLSEHWVKTADTIQALASDPEIKKAILNLNAAGNDLRSLIAQLNGQVQPTGEKLAQTLDAARKALATFDAAASGAQRFIAAQNGIGEDTNRTMEQLREAAASVQRLADFLERNPNALITGRKQE
jgi:paraquat-inducible protein B